VYQRHRARKRPDSSRNSRANSSDKARVSKLSDSPRDHSASRTRRWSAPGPRDTLPILSVVYAGLSVAETQNLS
jgi:hypothetical protein